MTAVDPITQEILRHAFSGIAEEMAVVEYRSSFSPIIREMLDFSCGTFDDRGRMISHAEQIPAQLGLMQFALRGDRDPRPPGARRRRPLQPPIAAGRHRILQLFMPAHDEDGNLRRLHRLDRTPRRHRRARAWNREHREHAPLPGRHTPPAGQARRAGPTERRPLQRHRGERPATRRRRSATSRRRSPRAGAGASGSLSSARSTRPRSSGRRSRASSSRRRSAPSRSSPRGRGGRRGRRVPRRRRADSGDPGSYRRDRAGARRRAARRPDRVSAAGTGGYQRPLGEHARGRLLRHALLLRKRDPAERRPHPPHPRDRARGVGPAAPLPGRRRALVT